MKPRNNREREVFNLSQTLKPHKRLLNKVLKQGEGTIYHVIAEVVEDYQVFRYFRITYHKRKENTYWETQQLWYKDGKETLIARKRMMGRYYDVYSYSSNLEIRNNYVNYAYNSSSMIPYSSIDIVSLKPEWDRNLLMDVSDLYCLSKLTMAMNKHPYIETLYKQQKELLIKMYNSIGLEDIIRYSPEIKVAIRHGYDFKDISLWADTIRMAQSFNIDTRNPYYCAPKDTMSLHNRFLNKVNKQREERRVKSELESLRRNIEKYSDTFNKHVKPFLNLLITDGSIEIRPLRSIEEYCQVGMKMHNCVYACGYFKKTSSLILLATHQGEIAELIELDLPTGNILQCRGTYNKQTLIHDNIVSLLNNNLNQIKAA